MALRTPWWLPEDGRPTTRGWVSANGELLKAQKLSKKDVEDWNDRNGKKKPVVQQEQVEDQPQTLLEAPYKESALDEGIRRYFYASQYSNEE
jgi:hypothetical protein